MKTEEAEIPDPAPTHAPAAPARRAMPAPRGYIPSAARKVALSALAMVEELETIAHDPARSFSDQMRARKAILDTAVGFERAKLGQKFAKRHPAPAAPAKEAPAAAPLGLPRR